MDFIKKIMKSFWEINYYFTNADLGAFIYDRLEVKLSSMGDNYVLGKFEKFKKQGISNFQKELDTNNQHNLAETILAFCGLFSYPFIKRMAKHTNLSKGKYVRFYGSKSDFRLNKLEDQFWIVFHLPSLSFGKDSCKHRQIVLRGSFRQFKEDHEYLAQHIGRVEDLMKTKNQDPISFGFLDNISVQFPSEDNSRFIVKDDVLYDVESISLGTPHGSYDQIEYGKLLSDEIVMDILENGNRVKEVA